MTDRLTIDNWETTLSEHDKYSTIDDTAEAIDCVVGDIVDSGDELTYEELIDRIEWRVQASIRRLSEAGEIESERVTQERSVLEVSKTD